MLCSRIYGDGDGTWLERCPHSPLLLFLKIYKKNIDWRALSSPSEDVQEGEMLNLYVVRAVSEDVVGNLSDPVCVSSFPRWHRDAQYMSPAQVFTRFIFFLSCTGRTNA